MIRDIGPSAAALLLTVLAHIGLPLSRADPLRSTLVLLPLIVVALLGVGRWARARGGSGTPAKVAISEVLQNEGYINSQQWWLLPARLSFCGN